MRRSIWIAIAAAIVGGTAATLLSARTTPTRVFAKRERISVRPTTGQWYHSYSLLLGVPERTFTDSSGNRITTTTSNVDTLAVTVDVTQYDTTRIGDARTLNRVAWLPRVSWMSDSTSAWRTLQHFATARIKSYQNPTVISPLDVQTAGLARVIAVHNVQRRTLFWQHNNKASSDRSRWLHLIEVEFWAPRARGVVRTIDVVDAGSIPGLRAGDIVQMHYDQRDPRVLRLDDGMRTFGAGKR